QHAKMPPVATRGSAKKRPPRSSAGSAISSLGSAAAPNKGSVAATPRKDLRCICRFYRNRGRIHEFAVFAVLSCAVERMAVMTRRSLPLVACILAFCTAPVFAALAVGAKAPVFTLQASQGGNTFTFNLADALAKGPVVLYFYPAAFTKGC